MFHPDRLILRILYQSFEIERPKGHWSEVVVHLYLHEWIDLSHVHIGIQAIWATKRQQTTIALFVC